MAGADEYRDRSVKNARDLASSHSAPKKQKSVQRTSSTDLGFDGSGKLDSEKQWWESALETPVVKGILDALSTGAYSSANYAKFATESEADKQATIKKAGESAAQGDTWGAAVDYLGSQGGHGGAVAAGLLKGLSAGFGGNEKDATLYNDVIKQAQVNNGIDPNSEESKLVAGIGGFIGDVALDPSTYIGLGAAGAAARGVIKGSREAGIAAKTAKEGVQIGQETSRVKGAIAGAKREVAKHRWDEFQRQEAKSLKRDLKKGKPITSYEETVEGFKFLPEKLLTGEVNKISSKEIRAAVKKERIFNRKVAESGTAGAEATQLIQKLLSEEINPQVAEAGLKSVANAAEESPVGIGDVTAPINPAPKTIGESVVHEKAPRSNKLEVDANTITAPSKIVDDIPSEAKFGDYANYTPVDRFVMGTEHLTAPKLKYTAPTAAKIKQFMEINPDISVLDYDSLLATGLKEADVAHVLLNGSVEGLTRQSGNFTDIFKGIKAGAVEAEDVDKFHQFMKGFTENPELTLDEAVDKAAEFVKNNSEAIQKSSRSFAPTAVNGRLTNLNKGAGKAPAISIMQTLPSEVAQQFRKPLTYEQSQAFLGDMLEKTKADILNGVLPAETAEILDRVLVKHFEEYSTPSGPYRTNNDWSKATMSLIDGNPKKEYWWTTHSAIDLFRNLNREISAVLKGKTMKVKTTGKDGKVRNSVQKLHGSEYHKAQDSIFMRVAANIDTTLKGYGIFPYLTNLMPEGGMAIRASMYDVLEAMGPTLRRKYIFVPRNTPSNIMVTSAMDVGEMLMRSIGGVEPGGKIDIVSIKPDAIRVLKGEYRNIADEKGIIRAIEENLDPQVKLFNDRIVEANIRGYKNAEKVRNQVYSKLFDDFVKAGPDGTSPMSKLAETVLRNTSLHSSHLSHQIITASDEVLERLQTAIDTGSVGRFSEQIGDFVAVKSKLNPEAAKMLNEKVAEVKRQFVSPREEIAIDAQKEIERQARLNEAWGIKLPDGKTKATAREVAIEGKQILPNGKQKSTLWHVSSKGVISSNSRKAEIKIAKANAKLAARTKDPRLNPENLGETVANGGTDEIINLTRQQHAWDVVTRLYGGQRMFNRTFGMSNSYAVVSAGIHLGTHLETQLHEVLNVFAKKHSFEDINIAFKQLQEVDGDFLDIVKADPQRFTPTTVELGKLTSWMFDSSKNNFYVRNGVGAAHMNSILNNMTHVPQEWRFPTGASPDQMSEAWKAWTNVKNPLKAIAAVHTAMVKAAEDVSMGARFSEMFGVREIPAGERSLWVKVENKDGKNAFARLIDNDLYYPKEIADELPALNNMITESRAFKNETLNKWASEVFDPITSAIKLTQTTMKPGHHVMSLAGDLLRNSLAGMNFGTKAYKDNWRILRSRRKALIEMSELDQYARIKEIAAQVQVDGKKPGVAFLIGGKKVNISDESIAQLFEQKDIYLPIHSAGVAEDLLTTVPDAAIKDQGSGLFKGASKIAQGTNKAVTKLTNNRVIKINKFSAERDNFMRGALALHFMQSRNFKSIEEAADFASQQLRKWSPTARDLTAMESKSLRRVFLYYTWQRGIIPRVIESSIQRPGWATMPSKAMYNLAVANGIEPESLGDPFPPDQLFPDYYRNGVLGPQWRTDDGHYWGINPTSPVMDIMNSLGSGVSLANLANPFAPDSGEAKLSRTLMGMIHPAFKAPIELGTGTNLSTGAPIIDNGQYLSDIVGPVRYASKVTGHTLSPNGIIPRRTEAKFREGIAEDDWGNNAALETFNYLFGLQSKDYTSESAMKTAEYDQKAKEKADQQTATRTEWWK